MKQKCPVCDGRGWVVGDCHPQEACGNCVDGYIVVLPRVDEHMTDGDLTAAAELLKARADWSKFPKLAAIFQHRPCENRYWHELVALTLFSLENNAETLNKRNARKAGGAE